MYLVLQIFSSAFYVDYFDFNSDISQWNMSNATSNFAMFFFCESFNQNIGNWDMSKNENMMFMFAQANSFKSRDKRLEYE